MKQLFAAIFMILPAAGWGQALVQGKVFDEQGRPLPGVNVYLEGTYDGAASDAAGTFSFKTSETGVQTLVLSAIGYETLYLQTTLPPDGALSVQLKEKISEIDEVVITAGAFAAGDKSRASVMKPLDIVTTAGATADIAGVFNTLPGAQPAAENGRLYVRGGESRETKAYVDGLLVSEPFGASPANTPSRFRFSPFLFKGTFFSAGGYSAEYGQALSSVLALNTIGQPERTQTDIGVMTVGVDASQTFRFDNASLFAQASYTDLGLYFKMAPQIYDYDRAPRSVGGSVHYKWDVGRQTHIKWYNNVQTARLQLQQPSFEDVREPANIALDETYGYSSLSFKTLTASDWIFRGGAAFSYLDLRTGYNQSENDSRKNDWHVKGAADKTLSDHAAITVGAELFAASNKIRYADSGGDMDFYLAQDIATAFAEMELTAGGKLAVRPGIRLEYGAANQEWTAAPRLAAAYGLGKKSQLSFSLGRYYQTPDNQYFKLNHLLKNERADHYILNYQYNPEGRILRLEAYYKKYDNLVSFDSYRQVEASGLDNGGTGRAAGAELFWRDSQSVPGLDYWISYSFLNAKRKYLDYPVEATPGFAPVHTLSIVGKYFVSPLRTQIGVTYQFSSGRRYDDPNTEPFNDRRMQDYHNLSLNLSFLLKPNVIIHGSASNVPGFDHRFGRQYSAAPNDAGFYESIPVRAEAKRFIFLGCFITISKDKDANQLNNL